MRVNGSRNRKKGHNAERYYAKVFRDLGFQHCVTARYGSRLHDDAGIDLLHTGMFNVQIKAGKQRGMIMSDVLKYMKDRVIELFPKNNKEYNNINIVIHRKDVGRGKKRNEFDDIVCMTFNDFKKIINYDSNRNTKGNK